MLKRKKGIIFVISAPSGTGKTTICKKLVSEYSDIYISVSTTSRPPRKGEREGRDYFFVTEDKFKDKIRQGKFAEWTKVLGNYYGTEHNSLKRNLERREDVILSIDVKGGRAIKKYYPESVLIFLLPPSLEELKERLKKRGSETSSQLKERLKLAERELKEVKNYNYIVVNSNLEQALRDLRSIIISERCKIHRYDVKEIVNDIKR